MNSILLSNLTNYQKSLLTRLAYLDVDINEFKKLKAAKNQITISDLITLIKHPNEPYLGCFHIPATKKFISGVTTTNLSLFETLECAGLGDLEIIDLAENQLSGFNAICFKDSMQNVGFSFRGTDMKTLPSLVTDSKTDFLGFLTNDTAQIHQAQELFAKYKSPTGQNFLYGHSLGGFLAENVYHQNSKDIANTFVMNPLHINSELIQTPEQIKAFNSPTHFSCFVIGGDYVSAINPPTQFHNNIHYIKNNEKFYNNFLGYHAIDSAIIENGNFVECSNKDAFKGHESRIAKTLVSIINNKNLKGFISKGIIYLRTWFWSTKSRLKNLFKKKNTPLPKEEPKSTSENPWELEKFIGPSFSKKALEDAKQLINSKKSNQASPPQELTDKEI